MNTAANLTPIARQRVTPLGEQFVRPAEMARRLGTTPTQVKRWIDRGWVRASFQKTRRKGKGRVPTRFWIPISEVERVKTCGAVPMQRDLPFDLAPTPPPATGAQVA